MRVSRVLSASIGLRIAFSTLLETYKKKQKKKKTNNIRNIDRNPSNRFTIYSRGEYILLYKIMNTKHTVMDRHVNNLCVNRTSMETIILENNCFQWVKPVDDSHK